MGKHAPKLKFNHSKLRGAIKEVFMFEMHFAKAMGISHNTLSNKLRGEKDFTQSEMARAIEVLKLPKESVTELFFTPKVNDNEHDNND